MKAFRWLAVSLASVCGLGSLMGLVSLNTGAWLPPPLSLGLTPGVDGAAYRASAAGDLQQAKVLATAAIRLSPYQNNARLRLAYVDADKNHRLTQSGELEFRRTYDLMPIDADVAAWRIRFGLEHWEELTPASRQAVYNEAMAFAALESHDVNVREILGSIGNPSGSLAAALWLQSLEHRSR